MRICVRQDADLLSTNPDLPAADISPAIVVFPAELTEMLRAKHSDQLERSISYLVHLTVYPFD